MDGSIVNQYLGENVRELKKHKPSQEALKNARFYLSLFKQFRLLQQG
jgi:hypothetical protein